MGRLAFLVHFLVLIIANGAGGEPPSISSQRIDIGFDLESHTASIESEVRFGGGGGEFTLQLPESIVAGTLRLESFGLEVTDAPPGAAAEAEDRGGEPSSRSDRDARGDRRHVVVHDGADPILRVTYNARFEQDPEAGERLTAIHNFSMSAHVGTEGVFLSDGAVWAPRFLDDQGHSILRRITTVIEPVEGWVFVASGEPGGELEAPTDPCSIWVTPRPTPDVAIVGAPRATRGIVHDTAQGAVAIVIHTSPANARNAELFLDAAAKYLDLYTSRLGRFPFKRFTIFENFFSSGFAYPGFTLLGPQVIAMGERALAPGYLDHELMHSWWGSGVYVDPADGNWVEALTTYCTNYSRRIFEGEEGENAGREYRRDALMKLSTAPAELDNGRLDQFGIDPEINRFVGYDKGAFVFSMLEDTAPAETVESRREMMWAGLRLLAERNLGRRAGWDEVQSAIESAFGEPRDQFFEWWVHHHAVPSTVVEGATNIVSAFDQQYVQAQPRDHEFVWELDGSYVEIDPEFRLYRILPPEHIIPTIAGTFGRGGLRLVTNDSDRPEMREYAPYLEPIETGENILIVGRSAAITAPMRDLLSRTKNPITVADDPAGGFTIGGERFDDRSHAALHTMAHPDHPGRFITVFVANGDGGWGRLRYIGFYTRDSTIVWDHDEVIRRAVYEPGRLLPLDASMTFDEP